MRYAADLAGTLRNIIFVDQVGVTTFSIVAIGLTRIGCLPFVQEARSSTASRGTYHGKYCQGDLFSLYLVEL